MKDQLQEVTIPSSHGDEACVKMDKDSRSLDPWLVTWIRAVQVDSGRVCIPSATHSAG